MASKIFLDFFYIHSMFGTVNSYNIEEISSAPHKDALKGALIKTIHDIDTIFSKKAVENQLYAGTTAVVALLVDGQILVANVGDSKGLICSEEHRKAQGFFSLFGDSGTYISSKELTNDHNAHRPGQDQSCRCYLLRTRSTTNPRPFSYDTSYWRCSLEKVWNYTGTRNNRLASLKR